MACIALAWTSPEIVIIDIDRDKYRPFIARDQKCRKELELFLQSEDDRPVVVLVEGVHTLARVSDLKAKSFILFDTITAIRGVHGAVCLDQGPTDDPDPRRFTIHQLHDAIETVVEDFTVSKDAVRVSATLASKITLREICDKIKRKGGSSVAEDFVSRTCDRIVGRITKAGWVSRVRKPALAAGMDTQLIAEMERFVEDSSVSEGLWRGFYDLVELNVPVQDVESRYDVRGADLHYLTEILGSQPIGAESYASNPVKTKRRK